jgi:4-hydroxy-tetrahydrodipicolinate synthase
MTEFRRKPIEGVVALTPLCLDEDQTIDHDSIEANIRWLEDQGVHGFIQFASMGQMYAPSEEEFNNVVDTCVDASDDITCIVGSMAPNQQETIRRATYAESAGADGAMISPPFAFPIQKGWVSDFYHDIDNSLSGELAVMVYNYPPLTDVNITPDMWREDLLDIDSIKALKESNFSIPHHDETLLATRDELNFISAGDSFFWHDSMLGANGLIGILMWAAPQVFLRFYEECRSGNHFNDWTLEANRKIVRAMGGVTSLPNVPLLPYEPAFLNALAEIGNRPAGPPRKPYKRLPEGGREKLEKAVRPLVVMEEEL